MNGFITNIIAFVAALGVLISVHEFGHFWVARKLGVKVLRFSIGFGNPLWRRLGRDGVEYVVATIPLGGYVKMLDEREGPVPQEERSAAFNYKPLSTRVAVVAAGPAANLLFAILAYWAVFVLGDVGLRPLVGDVVSGSPAAVMGLRGGDEFVAVNGRPASSWERALYALVEASIDGGPVSIEVRDSHGLARTLEAPSGAFAALSEDDGGLESVGIEQARPVLPPVVGELLPGEPAARDGLQVGDRILSVDGEAIGDWSGLVKIVQASPGRHLTLEVERAGRRLTLGVTPDFRETGSGTLGRIGAAADVPEGFMERFRSEIRYGPIEAAGAAVAKTWEMSGLTLRVVWGMLSGRMSVHNLGGPITIAQSAGRSAEVGAVFFLKFLAILSISIGILNLLPVPVLDGGHLLYYLIEAVRGAPLSEEVQLIGQKIGLLLLAMLMALAFYVDLSRVLVN